VLSGPRFLVWVLPLGERLDDLVGDHLHLWSLVSMMLNTVYPPGRLCHKKPPENGKPGARSPLGQAEGPGTSIYVLEGGNAMFERERKLYEIMLGLCKMLTKDVDDAKLADLPAAGVNHPAWILTHLAICTDYAARLLGQPAKCPQEWHQRCGPGSSVTGDRSFYASKHDLMAALEGGQARVSAAAASATEEALLRPHGVQLAFVKNTFPTVGDLLAHLMTTHTGFHLGQLSMWRRMMGMPGVLGI
jgi:hypothetical protein